MIICQLKEIGLDFKENITVKINKSENIKIKQLDTNISFIYSDKQEIPIRN